MKLARPWRKGRPEGLKEEGPSRPARMSELVQRHCYAAGRKLLQPFRQAGLMRLLVDQPV